MAAVAFLVPAGFVLIGIAGLDPEQAWRASVNCLAAVGLASIGYWAIGFALQFGGVGLVYRLPELEMLVWEWSALSPSWGTGWGMAGLSGWFLSGPDIAPMIYALFLAHLPWAITAAILPVLAIRGRAPSIVVLVLSLFVGSILYPIAGNWVQGGGWLSAIGRNMNLGHGVIDFGGAGTVHLVVGAFGLSALVAWVPRREQIPITEVKLPPVQLPLLAIVGSFMILGGTVGWLWSNPLQVNGLTEVALMRGTINSILAAGGGALIPIAYTWFVTGQSDPTVSARGLAAGSIAGLAAGPFVEPFSAFLIGFLAGGTVPFVLFVTDGILRLDDATGAVHMNTVPAIIGLLMAGLFADGAVGSGWQETGIDRYLGVTGQGVTGLFAAHGFQSDFPSQLQAQVIGIMSLGLWGMVLGIVVCSPLALLIRGFEHSFDRTTREPATEAISEREPVRPDGFTNLHDIDLSRDLSQDLTETQTRSQVASPQTTSPVRRNLPPLIRRRNEEQMSSSQEIEERIEPFQES